MTAPTPDAVAQARDAYEDAYYEWRSERKNVAASVAVALAIKADKAWSALIAAVRAECADRVRLEARLANALRHLDDTLTKHPNSALAADAIHGALAVVNEVLAALEAQP